MGSHAANRALQPSNFKRTIGCPGWANLCKDVPVKPSSPFALEGSAAHYLGERCLLKNLQADHLIGRKITIDDGVGNLVQIECTEEMAEAVQVYVDQVRRTQAAHVGAVAHVEQKLSLAWLVPGMKGTGDSVIVQPLGQIIVTDYKHGSGVPVDVGIKVGDNPQLSIYALGALGEKNPHAVEEVTVTIVQPRAPHSDGPVRSITFDVEDLVAWGQDVVVPAATMAMNPDAPRKPGDWCKWCDGMDICPEVRQQALKAAEVMFDADLVPTVKATPPQPEGLSGEQLDRILEFSEVFDDWLKSIRAEAFRRLSNGEPSAPSKWKLVAGRKSNRAWEDPEKVYPALKATLPRKEVYVEKLATPAVIEKALKKKKLDPEAIINPLIKKRTPGAPILAQVTDHRPALPPKAEQMFGEPLPDKETKS